MSAPNNGLSRVQSRTWVVRPTLAPRAEPTEVNQVLNAVANKERRHTLDDRRIGCHIDNAPTTAPFFVKRQALELRNVTRSATPRGADDQVARNQPGELRVSELKV